MLTVFQHWFQQHPSRHFRTVIFKSSNMQAMKQKQFRDHIDEPWAQHNRGCLHRFFGNLVSRLKWTTIGDGRCCRYTREVSDPAHRQEYLDYLAQIEASWEATGVRWLEPERHHRCGVRPKAKCQKANSFFVANLAFVWLGCCVRHDGKHKQVGPCLMFIN